MWKWAYRLESIAKTRVPSVQKGIPNYARSVKQVGTGGKNRIEKEAFRIECIAKTKDSSRKKALKFVEIELDFFKKQ